MGHSSVSRVTKRELMAFVGRESIEAGRSEHVGRSGHWFSRVAQPAGLRVGGGNEVRQVAKARAACNEKRKSDVSGEVRRRWKERRGRKQRGERNEMKRRDWAWARARKRFGSRGRGKRRLTWQMVFSLRESATSPLSTANGDPAGGYRMQIDHSVIYRWPIYEWLYTVSYAVE